MAGLFDKTQLVQVSDDQDRIVVTIEIDGTTVTDDTFLTDFSVGGGSNVQLDRTFGGKLLVTAFGEVLSQGSFSGFSTPNDCSGEAAGTDLGAIYRKYRAGTNPNRTPVLKMAFDSSVYRGIIMGLSVRPWDKNPRILLYSISAMGSIL
jgi:hypothetical protein